MPDTKLGKVRVYRRRTTPLPYAPLLPAAPTTPDRPQATTDDEEEADEP